MADIRGHQDWLAEQEKIQELRQAHPDWYELVGHFTHPELMAHIGITALPPHLPNGYLRFRPEDFIVEELDRRGHLATIDLAEPRLHDAPDHRTLYATLVKIGIGTHEALDRVATALGLERKQVAYAGLKDAGAITAQHISLRGADFETAKAIKSDAVWLKDFSYGSGALGVGDLQSNRFTLTVRTEQPLDPTAWETTWHSLGLGVPNYYGTQRFGNRFLSHYFGKAIVQGQFELALKDFMTATNASERKYLADARRRVGEAWGNWPAVLAVLDEWPYTFHYERIVANYLLHRPSDWIGALGTIQEQVKLWVYAYMSFLVNHLLSAFVASQQPIPLHLPIPLSPNPVDREPYRPWLESDGVPFDFPNALRALPFIRATSRSLTGTLKPKLHGYKIVTPGVIVAFDLPTGAYATTVLLHAFTLFSGHPAPNWVRADELDPKSELQTGSLSNLKTTWAEYFRQKEVAEETG